MAQINAGRVRFVSRGEYNNTSQYFPLDLVNYNGNSYFAKENTTGNLPTDTTKWQLIAEKGNIGPTGPTGATGNGIASITKTSTSGLVDTYTITYTDGTTTTFQITNGEDGEVTQAQLDETNRAIDYYKSTLNALPKVEGQGTSITLDDTAETPMPMKLSPSALEQATTTGKNIFSGLFKGIGLNDTTGTETVSQNSATSDYISVNFSINPNYYLSGLVDTINCYVFAYNSNKEGLGRTPGSPISSKLLNSSSFTNGTPQGTGDIAYIRVRQYVTSSSTGTIDEVDNAKIQLEIGSTATDYEPYTGGIASPNPDYPQDIHTISGDNEIKVENINLWDEKWEIGGYNTTTGIKDTSQDKIRNKYPISCEPSTQYYICINNNESSNAIRLLYYDRNMNFISTVAGNRNTIITTPSNAYYMNIMCTVAYGTTYKNDICINISNTSINGNYYPHQEQSLPLNLPVENLIGGFDYSRTNNGISFTQNYNGSILASGTSTNYATSIGVNAISTNNWFKTLLPGVYTLSGGVNDNIGLQLLDENNTLLASSFTSSETFTITQRVNTYLRAYVNTGVTLNLTIMPQLEKGTKANSFTPYGTPALEYSKIGNYEDEFVYNTTDTSLEIGKWYLKKNVGRNDISASDIIAYSDDYSNVRFYRFPKKTNNIDTDKYQINGLYTHAQKSNSTNWNSTASINKIFGNAENIRYWVGFSKATTLSEAKTALAGSIYYYLLKKPEYILLNDTLQSQLTEIYKWVKAYQEQTNISQANNDLPFVIKASAVYDLSKLLARVVALEEE